MTAEQRLARVVGLNRAVELMAAAGIRERHPNATAREVFLRLAIRKLGPELAALGYPEVRQFHRLGG
jgi:hypothetical protein